ncbi:MULTISPECIES: ABC transporter permease [Microbacterium]|uniref:Glutathione transport system permease protein GsiC n=1 Tax=Microbacterium azadirachtae TaxID=582680 RepID=A0A0F0LT93_9MICO|nr:MULTISPECIES: ABC transporter permease [Microbacterium]KJL34706.1 Glutathione transport system permease protein GsiC [Microbacterium azadirachtae]PRB05441.1 ABC transporter permease [Microbacterium sp. MYb64]
MLLFTAKRLLSGIVLLVVVSIATFFLAHLAIKDPTAALLGTTASPAQQAALATRIGIDRPLLVQFWDWFSHLVTGDFGTSWRNFQPVGAQLAIKIPVTLSVVTFATLLTAVLGLTFGMIAGLRPGTWFDRALKGVSVVLFALPGFWVSLVLVLWFAVQLKWFPAVGYVQPAQSVDGWIRSLTLPAVSLALGGVVAVSEQLRNAVIAQSRQDWVRTLRSRGLSATRVNLHILRNASPAALTVIALMFVGLLSGAIVVEQIFSLPGIGQLTNQSSQNGDIPMLLGITVVSVVFVVIINLLLDLVLGWINPKVRVA